MGNSMTAGGVFPQVSRHVPEAVSWTGYGEPPAPAGLNDPDGAPSATYRTEDGRDFRLQLGSGGPSLITPDQPHLPLRFETMTHRSALLLERTGHDGQVLVAEPLIDDLLPFVSQAGKRGEAVGAPSL
jgi:hypothetical protein